VIPNGLHDKYFADETNRTPNLEDPTLISVNNGFGRRKNVRTLLRAFARLRNEYESATLRLLGDPYAEEQEAHQWSRDRGLTNGVDFVGQVPHSQVITDLRSADLLVHPSLEESFGNTFVEAMAQKTPVVAGEASGAAPWVLDDGEAGRLTDVSDPEAIATAVSDLLSSPSRWAAFSNAGYRRANEEFRLSKVIEKYLNVYHKILV
jgi:glycosyltransferase involved in cell wall biosynthesis